MAERVRNMNKQENRFNYSTDLNSNKEASLNLHHKYFQLYEKFSGESPDRFIFEDNNKNQREAHYNSTSLYPPLTDKDSNSVAQLHRQNKVLREQVKESQQTIQKLSYQLQFLKVQLNSIAKCNKIDSYEYQDSLKSLREEIQIILQKNRNSDSEIRRLKDIIRTMNEHQITFNYQLSRLPRYSKNRSLGKHNSDQSYCDKEYNLQERKKEVNEKQFDLNCKFIAGVKEMYAKIMKFEVFSLKQLWRWLKNIGQMLHRLKMWRKECRQKLKQPKTLSSQSLIDFIKEAMILID